MGAMTARDLLHAYSLLNAEYHSSKMGRRIDQRRVAELESALIHAREDLAAAAGVTPQEILDNGTIWLREQPALLDAADDGIASIGTT